MRIKDIVIALVMLGAGAGYLSMAMGLPDRDGIDAGSVPVALAWMMIALGGIEFVRAVRPAASAQVQGISGSGMVTVGITLALIAGFIVAMRPLGFPIASTLFLFLQFIVLTPSDRRPSLAFYAPLSVIASALIFLIFRYGFDLLLPAGPLNAWLN
ncbi:tripartite tricarboxylate transporter TctB family protein [Falsirhodobacter deserti]|uniref:tripartite tricarboxylate transporter TctB family protein n=1 Tax=Falsirhodobacter deserti TaxID=1365611 RepID=UPI000FE31F43|nr:tripartite tricarboxylate transporter TctB family protein [Falsirhodobacter deserti]